MAQITYTAEGMVIDGTLLPWAEIERERNVLRFKDHVIVDITWPMRRSSDVDSQYVMSREKWEWWKRRIIGAYVNFGEIDGKHSEVYGTIDADDIKVTDDLEAVIRFHSNYGWSSGRVDFLGNYTDRVLDGEIEDMELLREYPDEFKRRYGSLPE